MQPNEPTGNPTNQPSFPQDPQPQPEFRQAIAQPQFQQAAVPPQVQAQPQPQVTPPAFQPQSAPFSPPLASSSRRKPLLIIGIIIAVVIVLAIAGVAFSLLGGNKSGGVSILDKVTGGGIEVENYTSQGAKFQMQLPKGADITEEQNPYDKNLHSVSSYGPSPENFDYATQMGRSVRVTYEHQTDAARHTTSYADYLKNVKEDASSAVRHSDETYKTVMDKEEETTVAGHKAYIAQVTTQDSNSKSIKKMVYIYIDELTVYSIEFQAESTDTAFINKIDSMIDSFKLQ